MAVTLKMGLLVFSGFGLFAVTFLTFATSFRNEIQPPTRKGKFFGDNLLLFYGSVLILINYCHLGLSFIVKYEQDC